MILYIHSKDSVESSKLIQNVIILPITLYPAWQTLNFCIFVISNNKSFISQNLKVVGPLVGKFDFFQSLAI